MSAEVEKSKEEDEEKPVTKRSWKVIIKTNWPVGLKLFELVLAITCMGLIYEPIDTTRLGIGRTKLNLHHIGVMYTAYTGCMVTIVGFLIGRIFKDQLGFKTSFVFSTANSALFLTTGILLAADRLDLTADHFFHPSRYLLNMMTAAIVLTFFNAVIFIGDALVTFIYKINF